MVLGFYCCICHGWCPLRVQSIFVQLWFRFEGQGIEPISCRRHMKPLIQNTF